MLDFIIGILTNSYGSLNGIFLITGKFLMKVITLFKVKFDYTDNDVKRTAVIIGGIFYVVIILLLYFFS